MKKLFIAGLIALTLTSTAFAAQAQDVPANAVACFEASFTDAQNVSWTVGEEFARATCMIANEKVDVYYNADGEIVGSFKTFAYNKLPKAALDILTTQYTFPAYQLKECIEFTDASNAKKYYVSFQQQKETVILEISGKGYIIKTNAAL